MRAFNKYKKEVSGIIKSIEAFSGKSSLDYTEFNFNELFFSNTKGDDAMTRLNEIRQKAKELQKLMQDEGKGLFLEDLKEKIFDKYPAVKEISWTQYTPYFNDGEPCVFSVNTPELLVNFKGLDIELENGKYGVTIKNPGIYSGDYLGDDEVLTLESTEGWISGSSYLSDKITGKPQELFAVVGDLFDESITDVFLAAFGDGVRVTVSRDSIVVDDYDHD